MWLDIRTCYIAGGGGETGLRGYVEIDACLLVCTMIVMLWSRPPTGDSRSIDLHPDTGAALS